MGTDDAAEVLKSGVYRIDLGGGWYYIGSSQDLIKRERQHLLTLRRGDHGNIVFQRAFDKYGGFSFTVLGYYPAHEILMREQQQLDDHVGRDKCANIAPTAGNCLGVKHTDEARANMSAAQMGKKHTPQHCSAMSAALTGRKRSDATRANMSAAQSRRSPVTEGARANMSAAAKGRKRRQLTPDARANMSAAQIGRKHTDITRVKMSLAHSGKSRKPHTAETRAKISAAATGRKHSDETRSKIRAAWAHWRVQREAAAAAL